MRTTKNEKVEGLKEYLSSMEDAVMSDLAYLMSDLTPADLAKATFHFNLSKADRSLTVQIEVPKQ